MKTKATIVTGDVSIWAHPRRSWEIEGDEPFVLTINRQYIEGEIEVIRHSVSLTVPAGIDLLERAVATLQGRKTEVMAEAQKKVTEIGRQISQLLMLAGPTPDPDVIEVATPDYGDDIPL